MRFPSLFLNLLLAVTLRAADPAPFEIKDGDRVLLLGDTLLERENTYGYLETRMHEQFPDRHFTVRNLSWAGDTPRGVSRASFDGPDKGWERLKESIAMVKPTVVFLGYGMAASLQEMTDRAQDITLNPDPTRYGSEPYSVVRFKKELGELMDAIVAAPEAPVVVNAGPNAPAVPGENKDWNFKVVMRDAPPRFVLLSPIRHEDLRAVKPGLPDPAPHNALLEQYSKAIEELAKEKGAQFIRPLPTPTMDPAGPGRTPIPKTDNGIHLKEEGYRQLASEFGNAVGWGWVPPNHPNRVADALRKTPSPLRAAVLKKNELFFHRFRPENATYLFGFRKHEQGQNAKEIPMFDPLIEQAEAEIDKLKGAKSAAAVPPGAPADPPQAAAVPKNGAAVPCDASELPRDFQSPPLDAEVPPPGAQVLPLNRQVLPRNAEVLPLSAKVLPRTAEVLLLSAKVLPHEAEVLPHEAEVLPHEAEVLPHEAEVLPHEAEVLPHEAEVLRLEAKVLPLEPSVDRLEPSVDRLEPSVDPREASVDRREASARPKNVVELAQNTQTPAQNDPKSPIPAKTAPTPPPLPEFTVQEGYQITLWAENPLLEKPTQMNWDAQGRLWVCSSSLYPQIEPGQVANDKILILEDRDGDGKAETSTVFADGLLIPTAVVPDFGEHRTSNIQHPTSKDGAPNTPPREAPNSQLSTLNSQLSTFPSACYVGQSTELLRFEDTDGDGKSDTKRVVFSGFGTEDTHHLIHTLKWGPDGRLYFNQSIYIHSHLETPYGMVRLNSGGIFAYDPRTERVEVLFKGLCNPWGHAWDQWGQSFMTDGAGGGGINWAVPGAMYFTYENGRRIMPSISPGSYPKFCSLELVHSPMFPDDWQGNAITNDFRAHRIVRFAIDDLSLTTENTESTEKGKTPTPSPSVSSVPSVVKSGYVTREMPDLVRTNDQSFRPIDVRHGPDGALYVADWSNPVINHGEVDFRDPRRDKHMGRIWRISKKDAPVVKWEPLLGKTNAELLEKLLSKSAWEQQQARSVLFQVLPSEFDKPSTKLAFGEALMEWTEKSADDAKMVAAIQIVFRDSNAKSWFSAGVPKWCFPNSDSSPAELIHLARAWSALPSAGNLRFNVDKEFDEMFERRADKSMNKEVFRAKLLSSMNEEFGPLALQAVQRIAIKGVSKMLETGNPRVRLEAMRALCRIPTAESAALVLEAALKIPKDDAHYDYAAWLSINDLAKPWTDAIASGAWKADTAERQQQLAWGLKAIDPALAGATLSRLVSENKVPLDGTGPWIELIGQAGGPKELRLLYLGLLAATVPDGDKMQAMAPKQFALPKEVLPRAARALVEAARLRNVKPENPYFGNLLPYYENFALSPEHPLAVWQFFAYAPRSCEPDVMRLLGLWKVDSAVTAVAFTVDENKWTDLSAASFEALRMLGSDNAVDLVNRFTDSKVPAIRRQAVLTLASLRPEQALPLIASVLNEPMSGEESLGVWRALVKDAAFTNLLATKLPADLSKNAAAEGIRPAREAGKNGAKLLAALTSLAGMTEADMPKDFKALAALAKQHGDPARGEIIYRQRATLACTVCHAIGGAGGKVGPDMTSIGASAPLDYIIESVLAPALKVKEGYNAVTLTLKDGTQAMGIQARETAQEVFLRDVTGREQAIAKAQITGTTNVGSIMPAGITDQLKEGERLDLYAFLGELGKPGPYDASKGTVARVWRLFSGADAQKVIGGESAVETGFAGYTLVDGRFVKELLAAIAPMVTNGTDTLMAVAQFQATGGKTRLKLTGAGKVWLDGNPLALSDDLAPELTAGVHTIAVKLDVKTFPEHLRAESPDVRFLGN